MSLDIHVELEELQRHITYLKTELGSCKALLLSIESAIASKTSSAVRVGGGYLYDSVEGEPWDSLRHFIAERKWHVAADGQSHNASIPQRSPPNPSPHLTEDSRRTSEGDARPDMSASSMARPRTSKRAARTRKSRQSSSRRREEGHSNETPPSLASICDRLREQREEVDRALNRHDELARARFRESYIRSVDFLALNRECNKLQLDKLTLRSRLLSVLANMSRATRRAVMRHALRSWWRAGQARRAMAGIRRGLERATAANWRRTYLTWGLGSWACWARAARREAAARRVWQGRCRRECLGGHVGLWKAAAAAKRRLIAAARQGAASRRFGAWSGWLRRARHAR